MLTWVGRETYAVTAISAVYRERPCSRFQNALANLVLDLDVIESQFRASVKERPKIVPPQVKKVCVITDLDAEAGAVFDAKVRPFLKALGEGTTHVCLGSADIDGVRSMMARLEQEKPDLIVTYRHLFEKEKDLPFSLGTYADMLTQTTTTPVLLLPAPGRPELDAALENTDRVMVLSDHLVSDGRLINWGLRLVEQGGRITLVHIEDDAVFGRYLAAISKISGLDTELAETAIEKQLLHEASDYADEVKAVFEAEHPNVQVSKNIRLGHTVKEVLAVASHEECDLVVLNTKDEDQLAMAGKAYSVAVELIDKPLLLL